ncbi:tRNA (adenine(58)-N(1))-methyltransferase catalytic subunit TRMT61A-like [Amphiura filiformis]|uniref:tRNA (adenine(58)-N(1))-methyltransferase catalytic subunit TRMT61A-like n=1 Tax=Amphiura filiformis TaxID=82378 RepID=UPI003B216609
MSLLGYKKHIEEGDLAIVFIGHETMVAVTIKRGEITQTKYGALRHNDVLGKEYGSKISTVNQRGYIYVLHPSPELWTVNLPHRTQILYFTDISMVTMQLELKPGSIVVESGTGSGSMSHALARTIAPNGHLYTFEFHEQRAQLARAEFKKHGLGEVVTVEHRDVCQNGFGLEVKVDAVFLDLPSPHLAVEHAKKILKSGGRICTFSPCIEQVQCTCQTFHSQGFSDVVTMECLLRNYDTRSLAFPVPNLGFEDAEIFESTKSEQSDVNNSHKAQEPIVGGGGSKEDGKGNLKMDCTESSSKETVSKNQSEAASKSSLGEGSASDAKRFKNGERKWKGKPKSVQGQNVVRCAVPNKETSGHTGYLTFATLFFGSS